MPIDPNQTVDEVMRRWPATIQVFIRFRMLCVGCPIATFHLVSDACREHDVSLPAFLAALEEAVAMSLAEPDECAWREAPSPFRALPAGPAGAGP